MSLWWLLVFCGLQTIYAQPMVSMVLVGGDLDDNNTEIYGKIIELAGGPNARIGIITAASSTYLDSALSYIQNFIRHGALEATWIPVAIDRPGNEKNPAVLDIISGMTGFYFGGGDQTVLKQVLKPNNIASPALNLITYKIFKGGAVVSGSSAGCDIIQGSPMVTGGETYEGLLYGPVVASDAGKNLSYDPTGGFDFFRIGMLDTHVGWRGRIGRDLALMLATKTRLAFGIDQNSALYVSIDQDGSARLEAIGQYGVNIMKTNVASIARFPGNVTIRNVYLHYMTKGDIYDFIHDKIQFAPWKSLITTPSHNNPLPPSHDIWSSEGDDERLHPREFLKIATDLMDSQATSTVGFSYERSPQFKVMLTKTGQGFKGNLDGKTYISYRDLKVDIFTI